jgi:hypothetical protein
VILQLRIHALYDHSIKIAIFMGCAFGFEIILVTILFAFAMHLGECMYSFDYPSLIYVAELGCVTSHAGIQQE